jgi:hypothetical protein
MITTLALCGTASIACHAHDRLTRWMVISNSLERMKGGLLDSMSDAIERAAVMLYGVSEKYKESANVSRTAAGVKADLTCR